MRSDRAVAPAGPSDRVWSWVDHLRAGGTTSWQAWAGPGQRPAPPSPFLPGAHQLELLRRVNLAADGREVRGDLAGRVLQASALGRGGDGLPLLGEPGRRFGPRAVDPGLLPAEELLRVAVLLVADTLADRARTSETDDPREPSGPADGSVDGAAGRQGHRRPIGPRVRRGYRLVGDPWVAGQLRAELRRRDRPPGGRRPRVLVAAGPVDQLLADTWAHRVLTSGAPAWSEWVANLAGGRLPPGAAPAQHAAAWRDRVGRDRVLVVTDPARLPRLAGVRRIEPPPVLGHAAIELARQVRGALGVVTAPVEHPALLAEQLLPWLLPHQGGPPPEVPPEHARWVRRRAERQRRHVLRAGYAVAGDVDALVPGGDGGAGPAPDGGSEADRVLDLAARMLAHSTDEGPDQGPGRTAQTGEQRA